MAFYDVLIFGINFICVLKEGERAVFTVRNEGRHQLPSGLITFSYPWANS